MSIPLPPALTQKFSSARVLAPFLFTLTCLSVIIYSLYQSQQLRQHHEEWVLQTSTIISMLGLVNTLAVEAETGTRGYLLSGHRSALEPYEVALQELPIHLNTLRPLMASYPEQKQLFAILQQLIRQRVQLSQSLIQLRQKGPNPGLAQREIKEGKPLMDRIRHQISQMTALEKQRLVRRQSSLGEATRQGKWWGRWLVGICLLMVLTAASLAQVLRKSVRHQRRLHQLQEMLVGQLAQQQQLEADLIRQTDQLRTTLDASLNGILSMSALRDEQGEIIDFRMDTANTTVKRMTGRDVDELLGRTLLDIFPGNAQNGFLALYKRVVNTGEAEHSMQYYQDDQGLEGWFEVSAVKQNDDRVVVTFINVTDHQQAKEKAERTLHQLQESNDNLAQFAFVASHDLQAPLRKIQSFGELLLQQHGPILPDSGTQLVNRMLQTGERMSHLIRGLLNYSQLGGSHSPHQRVDLGRLMDGILDDLELIIVEKQALVEVDQLPQVWGDPVQLQQLFSNLVSNALKFTKQGRKPRISIRCQVVAAHTLPGSLLPVSRSHHSYYELSVLDNGIGFEEQYIDRIFKLFERLHGKNSYPGSGIGLAICKQIVMNHEGMLRVESKLDEGASFHIYLPVMNQPDLTLPNWV
ncbi:CHASE3 domain-containing protein [Spirosoma sp. BT702]|uniref:histidine kinase n=1 Tax=Spirosoma profusum TaxID=2771354 RepID=A0A927GAL3_9BACT|nr:CHASE3 domain-containing protein [Spirosoma profusum]MBD2705190.1 CHASE3 domain-containing protein [Spirosoma profusum]